MERERKEDALIMTAPINCDEDHESDHNIILHHGSSYDPMIIKMKKGVMW